MWGSGWRAAIAAALVACGLGLSNQARAEEWVPAARTPAGDLFEIDLTSASRNGQIAQTWVRETLAKPQRDRNAGKDFVTELDRRLDDCQNRRFDIPEATRRDGKGRVVATGQTGITWTDIVPETVSEGIWTVACRIGEPIPEKALLDNIAEGRWVRVGLSADKKYYFSIRYDDLLKLDADHVLALSRNDYIGFDMVHGYPIKYMIQANIVDCRQSKTALFGVDSYMAADVRAESYRTPAAAATFEPIVPGSFMADSVAQICAQAVPLPKTTGGGRGDDQDEAQPGDVASGTAWGVSKGYLVTASHVIKGGSRIAVFTDGQPVGLASVVADDPASDIALLKLKPLHPGQLSALPLAEHVAVLGKSVFTLGYPEPGVLGQQVKMTAGEVSSASGFADNARLLRISVPIQPGNSGGPVLGWDGAVVGIADSTLSQADGPPLQNVNFAVKASYVRAMLEDLPDLGGYVLVKPAADRAAMVAAARKAVFMLVVTQ